MAEQHLHSIEQIPITDWEATPASVKHLVLSLLTKDFGEVSPPNINQDINQDICNILSATCHGNLMQFLDATSVGIAVHNTDGDLIYINHAGRDLLPDTDSQVPKVSSAEELSQTFGIYCSRDSQPYPPEKLPSCLALKGKAAYADDLEVHQVDRVIPLEVVANPVFNPHGQVDYVIATFQDITQRQNADQALAETRMLYQRMVKSQKDFIFQSQPDATVTFVNPSLCEALGYSQENLLGRKWIEFVAPDQVESILQKIKNLNPENPGFLSENQDIRADGTIGWTQWLNQGTFNSQGKLLEIQSVGRDITATEQTKLELKSQKELLQLIFDNVPVMAALTSQTGENIMINQHLEKVLGWTQAEYQTMDVLRECYPDPADYEAAIQQIQTADNTWKEFRTRAKDGRVLDTTWTQIRLADGRNISFGMDITEQKQLVASLAQLNQELELRVARRTEALQQQGKILKEAQRVARLGSWEFFVETGEVNWSPELFHIVGYDPEQPAPSFAQQSRNIFPQDYQHLNFLVDRAIKFGESYELDIRIIREDRSLGYIFAKGEPIWDSDGQIRSLVGIAMDISDRKAAEIALAEIEAENRAIIQAIPDQMFRMHRAGLYLSFPGSKELVVSVVDEKIVSQTLINRLELEKYRLQVHYQNLALDTRQTQIYEQEVVINGNLRYDEVRVVPIENKEEVLFMIRDISDRKQIEMLLQQSQKRYETLAEASPIGVYLTDAQGNCLYVNQTWSQTTGLAKEEALGPEWSKTLHPEDRDRVFKEWYETAIIKNQFRSEYRFLRPDNSITWVIGQALPLFDHAGEIEGYVGTITDISDRKQAEQEIIRTTKQLEAANRELEAFAYSVSHDLRAPLRAIDGFSRALTEDYSHLFDEEAKDYFDRIHRAIERMGDLIDDLLRLAQVSRMEMNYGKVNLSKSVQIIATDLQEWEPHRLVEFVIAPEAIVHGDKNLIRVVLENLLQNAWKFTSHHPTARIEFGSTLSKRESQAETAYFIRDDGAGFDMAYANKLFGVFQRLHDTHEFPGTGIGLATVQRIIHRHGGQVWAEGAVEAGATIYFTLPNEIRGIT